MPTENLIFIIVVLLAIWLVTSLKKEDKKKESINIRTQTSSSDTRIEQLKIISEELISKTLKLAEELDNNGANYTSQSIMYSIKVDYQKLNLLSQQLGEKASLIPINMLGKQQPFGIYLISLRGLLIEIQQKTGFKFFDNVNY